MTPVNKIVYDLETQKTFDEVGGHHNLKDLRVSFLGVFSYSQQRYFSFQEKDLPIFEQILLKERPMIIGFNSMHFDNQVVQPYLKNIDISELPQLDLLSEVVRSIKTRLKLDTIAHATLKEGKSGHGLDAITYYQQGDFKSLAKYCLDDVRLTKDLYEYGCRHGSLLYSNYGEYRRIPISFGEPPFIAAMIAQAFREHRRIEVELIRSLDSGQVRREVKEIELHDVSEDRITAFVLPDHHEESFDLRNIFRVKETGATYAHQASLL